MKGRNLGKDPGKSVIGVEGRDKERYINCRPLGKWMVFKVWHLMGSPGWGGVRERDRIVKLKTFS